MACVLGEIDLVRALGLGGVRCAVAAVPGDPANYSKHTKQALPWFDPWTETERMVDSLVAWGRSQPVNPVLFYNGDHDLLMVSRNRSVLSEVFDFVIGDEELVEDLVDKQRFSDLARKLELPVPASVTLDASTAQPSEVAIGFPLIVKPVTHRHETWRPVASGKALRVEDEAHLGRVWQSLRPVGNVIAQRLIEGAEDRIESYHVFVSHRHERICEFAGRKVRTLPPEYGETTALEITATEDVLSLGRSCVEKMRLTGVAKLDLKRDPSGKLWLLEVNPRFNLWHHAAALAGANLPVAVFDHLTARRLDPCHARAGVTWCHPTQDAKAARRLGVPLTRWANWARRCEAKWAMSLRDPMPFLRGVIVRRLASRLRKR